MFIEDVNVSKLDVSTSKAVNLVNAEPLNVFKFVTLTPCELLVDNAVDAEASNAVNLYFVLC